MGTELRFRDERGVDADAFDWQTPAEELGIPIDEARALYEEALRRAMYPGSRPAQDLYLEWLAAWEPDEPLADPGRRTLTMRIGQGRRRAPARRSRTPGKQPLTAHLGASAPRPPAPAQAQTQGQSDDALAAAWRQPGRHLHLVEPEARPSGDEVARGYDFFLQRGREPLVESATEAVTEGATEAVTESATEATVREPARREPREDRREARWDASDPASLVDHVRGAGEKLELPFLPELEAQLGTSLDFVEAYTGEAARIACQLMAAGAFAVRNVIAFADPSPQRELLLHELAHVIQMGGRAARAPRRFVPGSLSIGSEHSAAEHDANAAVWGARVGVSASPNVVHRGTTPPPPWSIEAAEGRWEKFLGQHARRDVSGHIAFAKAEPDFWRIYRETSAAPFQLDAYWTVVGDGLPKSAVERDLPELAEQRKSTAGVFRVVRYVEGETPQTSGTTDTSTSRRYAWINPAESPDDPIVYVPDQEPRHPDYNASWSTYCDAVAHLQAAGGIRGFTSITFGTETLPTATLTQRSGYTDTECQEFRHQLGDAIVADTRYRWQPTTNWQTFRDEVSTSGLPVAIIGDVFTRILAADFNDHQAHLVTTQGGQAVTVVAGQTTFIDDRLSTGRARGDGYAFTTEGNMILESKSGGTPPQPDNQEDETTQQAADYARIIKFEIAGITPPDREERFFDSCAYTFSTAAIAQPWAARLAQIFEREGLDPAQCLFIFPAVAGFTTFVLQVNPTFEIALEDRETTHHELLTPVLHHGVHIQRLVVDTAAPGSNEVLSGTATLEVAMDGAVEGAPVTLPITAQTTPDGRPGAHMDNSLPGLQSGLDQIFDRLVTEAHLTDDGVEATIQVTKGPSGIPNIDLDDATITVSYTNSGLAVTGNLNLHNDDNSIQGGIALGYSAGQWTFTGSVTLAAGMIEGLSELTARVSYEDGRWSIGVDQAQYDKQFGAVHVTGTAFGIRYDAEAGNFSGQCSIEADLGPFGKARAEAALEQNRLQSATLSYDSPELRYPPGSENPVIIGALNAGVTFADGRFSGHFGGDATLRIPGLASFTEDGAGLGLTVDGQIGEDGNFSGTISGGPLVFGDHFQIPSLSATLAPDGSISTEFSIEVVNVHLLDRARLDCAIDANGFRVTQADVGVEFGTENESRFWGALDVGYAADTGLTVGGDLHCKIKEGMVAHGRFDYSTETNTVSATLGIDDIQLLSYGPQRHKLFELRRQIPIASFFQVIGVYLDFGFTLEFDYEMDLKMRPALTLTGLSLETMEYESLEAEVTLPGEIVASLVGTPTIGIGIFAGDPSLIRGGGGLQMPITAEAAIRPRPDMGFQISYGNDGTVEGGARVGLAMTFGIEGSVAPYADFSVLDGAYSASWTGDTLQSFVIMPPKELFNYVIDLGGDMTTADAPPLPTDLQDPTTAAADHQYGNATDQPDSAQTTAAAPAAQPDQLPISGGGSEERPPEEPANFGGMTDLLKQLPGYQHADRIMSKAAEVWDSISGFFGQVFAAFGSWLDQLEDSIEEILDGFATEGLGYVRTLLQRIVGDDLFYVIEPLVDAVADSGEQIMSLFTEPVPQVIEEFFPWVLRIAQRVWTISFGSIDQLIHAIDTMRSRIGEGATRLITYMVNQGMIGVRRHPYYIPVIGPKFLAATEYKIHVLGVDQEFKEGDIIIDPRNVVAFGLFDLFEDMNVPPTSCDVDSFTGEPYRNRWR